MKLVLEKINTTKIRLDDEINTENSKFQFRNEKVIPLNMK